jgi:hypothetical protein
LGEVCLRFNSPLAHVNPGVPGTGDRVAQTGRPVFVFLGVAVGGLAGRQAERLPDPQP